MVTILGGAPWWVNAFLFVLIMVIAIAQWHVKKYSVVSGVLRLQQRPGQPVGAGGADHQDHRAGGAPLADPAPGRRLGLKVQSPGDRNGSATVLTCLSGRRLDELRAALESGRASAHHRRQPGASAARRRSSAIWPGGARASTPRRRR